MDGNVRRLKGKGVHWPRMREEVTDFIRSCSVCQQLRKDPTRSHGAWYTVSATEPNKRIAMDSIGPLDAYKYILVLIDCMPRYVELFPTRTVSAEECAEKLLEFYGRNGTPEELLSDNNKEFVNKLVDTFLKYTGTRPAHSIPYSHEDNARGSRHLAAFRLDFDLTMAWSVQLPLVQYILNTHINSFYRS